MLYSTLPRGLHRCSLYVLSSLAASSAAIRKRWRRKLQHDVRLRAAARAIYELCYPSEEWAPLNFEEAERCRTIHYRQAVGAALEARAALSTPVQPELFELC